MSPVDLFAALTGLSGAASAQPKGAAGAGAEFLSMLAALQGDGAADDAGFGADEADQQTAPAHDLKAELLSGAALLMTPAPVAAPVLPAIPALPGAEGQGDAQADGAEQPPSGAPGPQLPQSGAGDKGAPALADRAGAPVPPPTPETPTARAGAPTMAEQPSSPDGRTSAAEARPVAGEARADETKPATAAAAATKAAEAALAARAPGQPTPATARTDAAPPAPTSAAPPAPAAPAAPAGDSAAAQLAAAIAPQPARTPADARTVAQAQTQTSAPATGETAQQVRQMARAQGEAEADARRDGRQERMAPAHFRLGGETTASGPANPGPAAPTAPQPAAPTAPSPPTAAAPAPAQPPAPEILPPPALEPAPAESAEAAVEAETARLQETAAAQKTATGSQLSRATAETTALIASQIMRRLDGRATRFDMALTPAGLGRVDVRVEIDSDGRLAARLAFDNPAAATDLRGRADELRRELQEAGFQLAEDALDFSDREQGSARHAFEREDRAFRGAGRLAAEADEAAVAPAPARWRALTLTPEGVDMKV